MAAAAPRGIPLDAPRGLMEGPRRLLLHPPEGMVRGSLTSAATHGKGCALVYRSSACARPWHVRVAAAPGRGCFAGSTKRAEDGVGERLEVAACAGCRPSVAGADQC